MAVLCAACGEATVSGGEVRVCLVCGSPDLEVISDRAAVAVWDNYKKYIERGHRLARQQLRFLA